MGEAWRPDDDDLEMLSLLVGGMTDDDAATRLGWSRWRVRRRLRLVMDRLGAASRLQAGFLLAHAGWLPRPDRSADDGDERTF